MHMSLSTLQILKGLNWYEIQEYFDFYSRWDYEGVSE